jgi:hypothetical protein
MLARVHGSALACCKRHTVEVLLAERTSDEENQETPVVISTCRYRTGMAEKCLSGIGIFVVSQLCQSGIGIPASGSVRYRWPRISPALASYGIEGPIHLTVR